MPMECRVSSVFLFFYFFTFLFRIFYFILFPLHFLHVHVFASCLPNLKRQKLSTKSHPVIMPHFSRTISGYFNSTMLTYESHMKNSFIQYPVTHIIAPSRLLMNHTDPSVEIVASYRILQHLNSPTCII